MKNLIKGFFLATALATQFVIADTVPVSYTINPGDVLEVSVWGEEALLREIRVLPDGTISFPMIGNLPASGKTIPVVQNTIREKLKEFISDPVVSVAVKSVLGNEVYVIGQVTKPGNFVMYQRMNIMQVLSLAGGLTPFAKANNILILRREGDKSVPIKFEYGDVEDGSHLETNILLQSGDVIVVP